MSDAVNSTSECDPQVARLCEMLRALRRRNGLTQAALAARSGVSQPEISRIERALTAPSYLRLCTLLTSLGARLLLEANGSPVALNNNASTTSNDTTATAGRRTDRMGHS